MAGGGAPAACTQNLSPPRGELTLLTERGQIRARTRQIHCVNKGDISGCHSLLWACRSACQAPITSKDGRGHGVKVLMHRSENRAPSQLAFDVGMCIRRSLQPTVQLSITQLTLSYHHTPRRASFHRNKANYQFSVDYHIIKPPPPSHPISKVAACT